RFGLGLRFVAGMIFFGGRRRLVFVIGDVETGAFEDEACATADEAFEAVFAALGAALQRFGRDGLEGFELVAAKFAGVFIRRHGWRKKWGNRAKSVADGAAAFDFKKHPCVIRPKDEESKEKSETKEHPAKPHEPVKRQSRHEEKGPCRARHQPGQGRALEH